MALIRAIEMQWLQHAGEDMKIAFSLLNVCHSCPLRMVVTVVCSCLHALYDWLVLWTWLLKAFEDWFVFLHVAV